MEKRVIKIGNLTCLCATNGNLERIAYVLYPMNMLSEWVDRAVADYDTTIVVITGMDWQNVFSPWPAKGVPKNSPDFKGQSPEFLKLLQGVVVPQVEASLGVASGVERTIVGVSMSGLFALWQWMQCSVFQNLASLSGSFWYEGFIDWFRNQTVPPKKGKAFFLLGDKESKSPVKAFDSVGENTQAIVNRLTSAGIDVEFKLVPGNHYAYPLQRLTIAFDAIYKQATP